MRAGLAVVSVAAGAACTGAAFNRYLVNDDYSLLYTGFLESIGKVPGRDYVLYSDHALTFGLRFSVVSFRLSVRSFVRSVFRSVCWS